MKRFKSLFFIAVLFPICSACFGGLGGLGGLGSVSGCCPPSGGMSCGFQPPCSSSSYVSSYSLPLPPPPPPPLPAPLPPPPSSYGGSNSYLPASPPGYQSSGYSIPSQHG